MYDRRVTYDSIENGICVGTRTRLANTRIGVIEHSICTTAFNEGYKLKRGRGGLASFGGSVRRRYQLFRVNASTDRRICMRARIRPCVWLRAYACGRMTYRYKHIYGDTCIAKGLPSESGSPGQ